MKEINITISRENESTMVQLNGAACFGRWALIQGILRIKNVWIEIETNVYIGKNIGFTKMGEEEVADEVKRCVDTAIKIIKEEEKKKGNFKKEFSFTI